MSFVHLQTHSEFSILRASCRIKELLKSAVEKNQPAVALTDHGNMFGILEFFMQAKDLNKERKKAGLDPIKPLLGCHIYVATPNATRDESTYQRLTLLVENQDGYYNLLKIVSYCYESPEAWAEIPAVPLSFIKLKSKGLIALAGDLMSRFGTDVTSGRDAQAIAYIENLRQIFDSEHLYLTLQDHGLDSEKQLNQFIIKCSEKYNLGLVATNNVHYIKRDGATAHKALRCIALAEKLQDYKENYCPTDKYYFRSSEEMAELFLDHPEAIENTGKIAARCDVTIRTNCGDEYWPKYAFPKEFADADAYLAYLCEKKVSERYDVITDEIRERLDNELKCIKDMHVAGYLLIVWDFINWSRENGIPVGPGRGSAAGSIVTYIIGITDIDPLRFVLLFERFLNPERVSMPDIDTDISDRDRGRVIQYVTEKYGADCVSQIVTYGALKAKAVINDVGRVLGLPIADVRMITKKLPETLGATLTNAWTGKDKKGAPIAPDYNAEEFQALIKSRESFQELWKLALELEDLARQTGVHAAAVVIAPTPMSNLAPLFRAKPEDTPVVMFDKHYAEDIGLLKMDFLGLRNLSIIQDAVALIKQTRGFDLEIGKIPLDDRATFNLLSKGLTVGVFQFESIGMQEYLKKLQPTRIEDLIAMNALYRPGPIDQIPHFILRKQGEEKVDCYHPDLESILSETYGVIVYQEQVMLLAQKLGGYTLGGADIIRRIMAKKKPEEMAKLEPEFMEKCIACGYDAKMVKKVWAVLLPFCGYAFNKSHAAAYAYLAYQTAYLKANYGPEFMAASMTSEISKTDNIVTLVQECAKMNVKVRTPDINTSLGIFSANKEGEIIYGLAGIRNVGLAVIEDVVTERNLHGPYKTLFDLCKRILDYQTTLSEKRPPLNRKALECLVMAGALDCFPGSRPALMASIDKALEVANRYRQDKDAGQVSLFDMGGANEVPMSSPEELEDASEWSYIECLNKEREVLGLYLSGHPLEEYRPELRGFTTCSLADSELAEIQLKSMVFVGGIITSLRSLQSKKDDTKTFGTGTLQDFHGEMSLFFPSDSWERHRDRIAVDDRVLLKGKLEQQRDSSNLQIIVERIFTMDEVRDKLVNFIHISVSSVGLTPERLHIFEDHMDPYKILPGERGSEIVFHLETLSDHEHTLCAHGYKVTYAPDLLAWLQKEFGASQVWVSGKVKG